MKQQSFFLKRRLNEKKFERRVTVVLALTVTVVLAGFLALPGASSAAAHVVKEGGIENVPGFRFENLIYNWDKLFVDVVNMTRRNMMFEGTMVFLDRRGNPVAIARLLPAKVVRESARRYSGHFVEGTGETARRAVRVFWDFSPR